jgi:hypothetical protein
MEGIDEDMVREEAMVNRYFEVMRDTGRQELTDRQVYNIIQLIAPDVGANEMHYLLKRVRARVASRLETMMEIGQLREETMRMIQEDPNNREEISRSMSERMVEAAIPEEVYEQLSDDEIEFYTQLIHQAPNTEAIEQFLAIAEHIQPKQTPQSTPQKPQKVRKLESTDPFAERKGIAGNVLARLGVIDKLERDVYPHLEAVISWDSLLKRIISDSHLKRARAVTGVDLDDDEDDAMDELLKAVLKSAYKLPEILQYVGDDMRRRFRRMYPNVKLPPRLLPRAPPRKPAQKKEPKKVTFEERGQPYVKPTTEEAQQRAARLRLGVADSPPHKPTSSRSKQ